MNTLYSQDKDGLQYFLKVMKLSLIQIPENVPFSAKNFISLSMPFVGMNKSTPRGGHPLLMGGTLQQLPQSLSLRPPRSYRFLNLQPWFNIFILLFSNAITYPVIQIYHNLSGYFSIYNMLCKKKKIVIFIHLKGWKDRRGRVFSLLVHLFKYLQ